MSVITSAMGWRTIKCECKEMQITCIRRMGPEVKVDAQRLVCLDCKHLPQREQAGTDWTIRLTTQVL